MNIQTHSCPRRKWKCIFHWKGPHSGSLWWIELNSHLFEWGPGRVGQRSQAILARGPSLNRPADCKTEDVSLALPESQYLPPWNKTDERGCHCHSVVFPLPSFTGFHLWVALALVYFFFIVLFFGWEMYFFYSWYKERGSRHMTESLQHRHIRSTF